MHAFFFCQGVSVPFGSRIQVRHTHVVYLAAAAYPPTALEEVIVRVDELEILRNEQ